MDLRGQATAELVVHFCAAAPVHIPAAVDTLPNMWVRYVRALPWSMPLICMSRLPLAGQWKRRPRPPLDAHRRPALCQPLALGGAHPLGTEIPGHRVWVGPEVAAALPIKASTRERDDSSTHGFNRIVGYLFTCYVDRMKEDRRPVQRGNLVSDVEQAFCNAGRLWPRKRVHGKYDRHRPSPMGTSRTRSCVEFRDSGNCPTTGTARRLARLEQIRRTVGTVNENCGPDRHSQQNSRGPPSHPHHWFTRLVGMPDHRALRELKDQFIYGGPGEISQCVFAVARETRRSRGGLFWEKPRGRQGAHLRKAQLSPPTETLYALHREGGSAFLPRACGSRSIERDPALRYKDTFKNVYLWGYPESSSIDFLQIETCLSMKVRSPMPCSCSCLSPTRSQRRRRELHGADSDMAQRLETAMAHTLRLGSLAELHG